MLLNLKVREIIQHSFYIKMQGIYSSLKTAERKAADAILNQPELIAGATLTEASNYAECSEATFIRLVKKLGYSGFSQMKENILDASDYKEELFSNISEEDGAGEVLEKVVQASSRALNDTLQTIESESFQAAVERIQKSKRIMFCGVGDAFNIARSGCQKFLRLGLNAYAYEDMDMQLIKLSSFDENDVVVAISHSGKSKVVHDVVKYAKSRNIPVILITNFPFSPIAKISDILLITAVFIESSLGEVIAKRVIQFCLIEAIFVCLIQGDKNQYIQKIKCSNNAIDTNKI